MEVILKQRVQHLGDRGQIVRVADGYARNYLLPHGMAMVATKGARKEAQALVRAEARKEQERRTVAVKERDQLHGKAITVRERANSAGKLFGSVPAKDICEALRETYGLNVDPTRCEDHEPIREVGTFTVNFLIYDDIKAEVTVNVRAVEEAAGKGHDEAQAEGEERRAPRPKPIIPGGGAGQDN
jgi:large subunit ribosomal protein L9